MCSSLHLMMRKIWSQSLIGVNVRHFTLDRAATSFVNPPETRFTEPLVQIRTESCWSRFLACSDEVLSEIFYKHCLQTHAPTARGIKWAKCRHIWGWTSHTYSVMTLVLCGVLHNLTSGHPKKSFVIFGYIGREFLTACRVISARLVESPSGRLASKMMRIYIFISWLQPSFVKSYYPPIHFTVPWNHLI